MAQFGEDLEILKKDIFHFKKVYFYDIHYYIYLYISYKYS